MKKHLYIFTVVLAAVSCVKGPEIIEEIVYMNNKIKFLRSTDTDDSDDKEEGEGGTVRTL